VVKPRRHSLWNFAKCSLIRYSLRHSTEKDSSQCFVIEESLVDLPDIMGIEHSVTAPGRGARTVSRRIEALFCLLIIMAQLALVVAHSWEVPGDAAAMSATRAFQAVPSQTREVRRPSPRWKPVPRRNAHDPLLCPCLPAPLPRLRTVLRRIVLGLRCSRQALWCSGFCLPEI